MDIKQVEDQLSKFIYELENEDRLVRVGLKDVAESAVIYKKYKDLFTKETLEEVSKASKVSKVSKDKDIIDRIYFTLAGSYMGLTTAPEEDKVTTYFSKAKIKAGDETIAYFQAGPKIAKDPIFDRREKTDAACVPVVSKINPKQLALLKSEIKLIKGLGFANYVDFASKSKKMDYAKFNKVIAKTIKDTQKQWQKVMSEQSSAIFGKPFRKIRSVHLNYLRSMSMYDNYYPKEKVVETFLKWTRDIGLSDLLTSIKIDDVDRPKKNPRAVCYWPMPPKEIHLVIKPIGGEQDFEAVFHEGGHALHGASIDAKLPYTLKALAHSNALTETYAFVLEDLVFDPDFLTTYLNVSAFTGKKIQWQAYFVNLMMLRRYVGKFTYEYNMFSKNAISKGPALYAKTLESTTGFVHRRENWLVDMDGSFYSADYLRAWIGAAQIKDYLNKKFGKKWFLNKKAGEFLRKLYARGVTDEIEDVVKRLGYKPWDTSLLIKGYKQVLV
ncbi:MAG TPA: hypothetical protein VLE91_04580 [Candidatus Saccharimonadales bacterium]|nr:hypothetical protein [Candidatus Saccharimonadales bacterium]